MTCGRELPGVYHPDDVDHVAVLCRGGGLPPVKDVFVHVVDDDAAMRDSLRFLLRTVGLPCRTYASGAELLEAAAGGLAGCVVTDVHMPGMSGLELLRRLRASGGALPVIVITGAGDAALAAEVLRAGACGFLQKPFDGDAFLESVRAALRRPPSAAAG